MTQKDNFCDDFEYKRKLISDNRIPQSIRTEVFRELLQNDDYRTFMIDYMRKIGWILNFDK
jgi:hypothetical protein